MNGNNPYAGRGDVVDAGKRMTGDAPTLSPENRRALSEGVASIASHTRELLPGEFAVGSEITEGTNGPQVTVAVEPPVGNPVSAGLQPDLEADGDLISADDREEVARGLAASAALQVKRAVGDDFEATAK